MLVSIVNWIELNLSVIYLTQIHSLLNFITYYRVMSTRHADMESSMRIEKFNGDNYASKQIWEVMNLEAQPVIENEE